MGQHTGLACALGSGRSIVENRVCVRLLCGHPKRGDINETAGNSSSEGMPGRRHRGRVRLHFHDGAGSGSQEVRFQHQGLRLKPPPELAPWPREQGAKGPGAPIRASRRRRPGPNSTRSSATIKLPPGFKIAVWADGVPQARQMAWGDKGTLFVGTFDKGTVHAVSGPDGQKVVKPLPSPGLRMPTGVAFQDGALYVVDIDKLYRYDNPEANLEKAPEGKVVYDDFPPYVPHGWKYLVPDGKGWFYIPVGVPCNICLPPASTGHYRRVDPKTGAAEIVALGVRNSVGGAVDPQERPALVHLQRPRLDHRRPAERRAQPLKQDGRAFRLSLPPPGRPCRSEFGRERKCSEFTPPVDKLGPHSPALA